MANGRFLGFLVGLTIMFIVGVKGDIPVGTCFKGSSILYSPTFGTVVVDTVLQKVAPDRILFTAQPNFASVVFCLRTYMVETNVDTDMSHVFLFTDLCQAAVPKGAGYEALLPFCTTPGRYHVLYSNESISFLDDSTFDDTCTTRSSLLRGRTFVNSPCSATCDCLEGGTTPIPTTTPIPSTLATTLPPTPFPTPAPIPSNYPFFGSTECTPTTGGLVKLNGRNFNSLNAAPVNISISTVPCVFSGVLSSSVALCQFVPGIGGGYPVSINNNASYGPALTFSFCRPEIFSVDKYPVPGAPGKWILSINGSNFGWDPASIQLTLARPADFTPLVCQNVTVTKFHYSFICIIDNPQSGQYFLTLNVGGQLSMTTPQPFVIFDGLCYTKNGFSTTSIDTLLAQIGLNKSIRRLKGLLESLQQVKTALPQLETNDCCSTQTVYPLPPFELQLMSTDSLGFKDCIDEFCSSSEQYLLNLK
eukprot:TRINITY_DN3100_c0_g1_i1.p1 TRINITY_DN3100_c0_g1~~TRINITY_DN3100_c0_g1_i1.p1  ORF type:complete len:475 (+),score=134.38 TRINITY_DN3100_c0_g1_i1:234-1658(+)